jgi:zinc transport system substrate-binding protein
MIIIKPKTLIALFLSIAYSAGVVLLVAGCGHQAVSGKIKVSASIVPIADFCRQVGSDKVEVQTLVPPSAGCGHTFEPTTGSMTSLSEARVFVVNGLGLEEWATDVLKKVTRKDVVSVVASSAIPKSKLLATQDEDELVNAKPGQVVYDPHVWLDPSLAAYEVQAIRDGFVKADPANSSYYKANAQVYIQKLEALDTQLKEELSPIKGAAFIATHPTWTYFAPHYGLVQIGSVEELPGKEPSAKQISALVDDVRQMQVKVVFAEPQLSPRAVQVIASDAGNNVKVETVDPVGDPTKHEVSDYLRLLRFDAGVMRRAFQ